MPSRYSKRTLWRTAAGLFLALLVGAALTSLAGVWLAGPSAVAAPALVATGLRADALIVRKGDRTMTLMRAGKQVAQYSIRLGFSPKGDKMQEGDGRTPEGVYRINRRNPRSRFHLSLGLDYPKADQRAKARLAGRNPGGDIFIHGQPNALRPFGLTLPHNWTDGCIAVSNRDMEDLYARVPVGARVTILP
ncbi:L,D-transpeptidase family protein [Cohaesibacter sp. CAU 1516]|uniref:L,D-transpeptidase family protein n=1 Tax=Cohaesibacter sp. CAU 1516 TaxID=2576038 RepID=UPI001485581B|nr:L,D-transpeptidase family protein [Cohaesibacter sp. CAU 1516]